MQGSSHGRPFPLRLVQIVAVMYIFLFLLDVGMLTVSIMAYTGAQGEDDSTIIKHTYITFPAASDHIQRAEIALPALGILLHGTLMGAYAFRKREATPMRLFVLKYPLPWHAACVVAWAILVAFQADYVPVLGRGRLPECVEYGSELSQCGMVTAGWIFAIFYSVLHLLFVILALEMLRRMWGPKDAGTPLYNVAPVPPSGKATTATTRTRTKKQESVSDHWSQGLETPPSIFDRKADVKLKG